MSISEIRNNVPFGVWVILIKFPCSQMTPLNEDVPRSEMICMMAVPSKLTCVELQKFTQAAK